MTALLLLVLVQEAVPSSSRCMECHEEAASDWKGSAHAGSRIGCVECHGTDRVNPRGKTQHLRDATFLAGTKNANVKLCAACHKPESEAFRKSGHWEDPPKAKAPLQGCNSCHAFHSTAAARREAILRESCHKCHKEGSEERKQGEAYVSLMNELDDARARLAERLRRKTPGVSWFEEAAALEEADGLWKQARVEQHACRYAELESKRVRPAAERVSAAYNMLNTREQGLGNRIWALLGFLALLAANAALVWRRGQRWRQGS